MNLHDSHVLAFYVHQFAKYDLLLKLEQQKTFNMCVLNFFGKFF